MHAHACVSVFFGFPFSSPSQHNYSVHIHAWLYNYRRRAKIIHDCVYIVGEPHAFFFNTSHFWNFSFCGLTQAAI